MPRDIKEVLSKAEKLELFSVNFVGMEFHPMHLDSVPALRRKMDEPGAGRFYGCEVLGRTEIGDAQTRGEVLDALFAGTSNVSSGESMLCFKPRHGLRATHGGRTVRLLLCFECRNFYAYTAKGQTEGRVRLGVQEVFDGVLKAAGVPLTDEVLAGRLASGGPPDNRPRPSPR